MMINGFSLEYILFNENKCETKTFLLETALMNRIHQESFLTIHDNKMTE